MIGERTIGLAWDTEKNPDFGFAFSCLNKVFETLLLDKHALGALQIVGQAKSNGSSMANSVTSIGGLLDIYKEMPGISGVGYRFFQQLNENLLREFKVEPYLADDSAYYLECILHIRENFSLEDMANFTAETYTYFKTKFSDLALKYFVN